MSGFSFVRGPYQQCPACGESQFGRLMVNGRSYVRRCDACRHSKRFELPKIRKTILYLDQMAISGMMKALNPRHPKHAASRDEGWLDLFEKLDRLAKLQLVVCPESPGHEIESLLYGGGFAELRRLYEHLSQNVRFRDPDWIRGRQVYLHAGDWIKGDMSSPLVTSTSDGINGQPHEWRDTLLLSVRFPTEEGEADDWRRRRETGASSLEPVFRRWQGEGDLRFEDWYREELDGWPQFVWADFLERTGRMLAGVRGLRELDMEDFFPATRSRETVKVLMDAFYRAGAADEEALDRVRDFLFSGTLDRVPRIRIESLIWAGIAHQAARGGRLKPPNRGMMLDVSVVSSVLPYCDAVFVDAEVRSLLEMGPVRERVGFSTHVFSKSTMGGLLDFLDSIERDAPADVVRTALEVYGEPDPYVTILDQPPR